MNNSKTNLIYNNKIYNPYEILGVTPDTDIKVIYKTYKHKVKMNHPDKHPDNIEYYRNLINVFQKAYTDIHNNYIVNNNNSNVNNNCNIYNDLKSDYQQYIQEQQSNNNKPSNNINNVKFDLQQFNELFETHKTPNSEDNIYNIFTTSDYRQNRDYNMYINELNNIDNEYLKNIEPIVSVHTRFDRDLFNSKFEEHKKKLNTTNNGLNEYSEEPKPYNEIKSLTEVCNNTNNNINNNTKIPGIPPIEFNYSLY